MIPIKTSPWQVNTVLEPAAYIAMTIIAGKTRCIRYFPATTLKGLLLNAGIVSTAATLHTHYLHNPDHRYLYNLMGKVLTLAAGTVISAYITKPLHTYRVCLSPQAAARLLGLHALFAVVTTYARQETPLQREHRYYATHFKEWLRLDIDSRSKLINDFYEADLPAISLPENGYNFDHLTAFPEDGQSAFQLAPQLSTAQLSWIRLLCFVGPDEDSFTFAQQCLDKGLPVPEIATHIINHTINYVKETPTPSHVEVLYQLCKRYPAVLHLDVSEHLDQLNLLFRNKPRLPTLDHALDALRIETIETMDREVLSSWRQVFDSYNNTNGPKHWSTLSDLVRSTLIKRWIEVEEEVPYTCAENPGPLEWLRNLPIEEINALTDRELNMYRECIRVLPSQKDTPFTLTYKINNAEQNGDYYNSARIPYYLNAEVIQAAQNDPKLQEDLKTLVQQTSRQDDIGFNSLSIQNQHKLKTLLKDYCKYLPLYRMSPETIRAAADDRTLLDALIMQFKSTQSYYVTDHDDAHGFFNLPIEQQQTIRQLFGEKANLLPYPITSQLIKDAETDSTLREAVGQQIMRYSKVDWGFFRLSAELQDQLRQLLTSYTWCIPIRITSELVADLQNDSRQIDELKDTIYATGLYGFEALTASEQATLRTLFGDGQPKLLPYQLTHDLIVQAQDDPALKKALIAQFHNVSYYSQDAAFGFSTLSSEDQSILQGFLDENKPTYEWTSDDELIHKE